MGPVDNPSFGVPLVLATELYPVTGPQTVDPGRQVYVVGYQQGLPRREFHHETLMPAPSVVVGEKPRNDPCSLYLDSAPPFPIKVLQ